MQFDGTSLQSAVYQGKAEGVELLLKAGANPDKGNMVRFTDYIRSNSKDLLVLNHTWARF